MISWITFIPRAITTTVGIVQLLKKTGTFKNKKWYSVFATILAGGLTAANSYGIIPEDVINGLFTIAGSTMSYDIAHDVMKVASGKINAVAQDVEKTVESVSSLGEFVDSVSEEIQPVLTDAGGSRQATAQGTRLVE